MILFSFLFWQVGANLEASSKRPQIHLYKPTESRELCSKEFILDRTEDLRCFARPRYSTIKSCYSCLNER